MAEEKDSGEKTEEPSQHKLDELRNKGDVASSKELNSVLILSATISVAFLSIFFIFEKIEDFLIYILNLNLERAYTAEVLKQIASEGALVTLKCIAPVLFANFCFSILSQVMQVGFIFAPSVLELKLERIDPLKGLGRVFSKKAFFEAFKGLFKFSIILVISYFILDENIEKFVGFFHSEIGQSIEYSKSVAIKLSFSILIGLAVMAMIDFAWEKFTFKQKVMMTKQELKEEHKEREGNPEVKQKIKMLQREMSQKRMMNDVKTADVIVTNPTHISIAIRYDTKTMIAPEVIAKGTDLVALKIRELAQEHKIPIVENIPIARALYKTVKIGEGVPRSLYRAVAEILAFVYKRKRKIKNDLNTNPYINQNTNNVF